MKRPIKSGPLLELLRVIRRLALKCSIYYKRCDTALDKQGGKYSAAFELGGTLYNVVDHSGDDPASPGLFDFFRILSHEQDPRDWGASKDRPWQEIYSGYRDAGVVEVFSAIAEKRLHRQVAKLFRQEAIKTIPNKLLTYSAAELANTPTRWRHKRVTIPLPKMLRVEQLEVDMVMERESFQRLRRSWHKEDESPHVWVGLEGKLRLKPLKKYAPAFGFVVSMHKPSHACRVRVRVKDRQTFVIGAT